MKALTNILVAAAVACAFVTPVFAQDTSMSERQILNFSDGQAIHVGAAGKLRMLKSNKDAQAMMMSKGTVVPTGAIFMWSGGKMYMMVDAKMDGGKMSSDMFGG